jgi:hypothetical protein
VGPSQIDWHPILRTAARVVLWISAPFLGIFWATACVVTVDQMIGRSNPENSPLWAAFVGTAMLGGLLFLATWPLVKRAWLSLLCLMWIAALSLLIHASVLIGDGYFVYGVVGALVWLAALAACSFLLVQGFRADWKRRRGRGNS